MVLTEVFLPHLIKCDLQAEDKDELFEELVDHYCSATHSGGREDILRALREREAKMSTGIEHGIAIPHSRTDSVSRIVGVLGLSQKGIDYDSLDGKPVHIVMMILTPTLEAERYLHVLKRMAEVLHTPQFVADLCEARTADAAFRILKKYESEIKVAETEK